MVLNAQLALKSMPGDWNALKPHVKKLLAASETVSDPKLLAQPRYSSAWVDFATGSIEGARQRIQDIVDSLDAEDLRAPARLLGHDPIVGSLSALAFAEWLLGHADAAKSEARRCRLRAEAVGAPQSLATGWHTSMTTALFRGEIEQARHYEEMLQQCLDRHEFEYLYMRPLAARTSLLTLQGRPEEAIRVAKEGIDKARENRALAYSSISLTTLADAQLAAGHLDDGLDSIEESLSHADSVGERIWRPESLRIKGRLLSAGKNVRCR